MYLLRCWGDPAVRIKLKQEKKATAWWNVVLFFHFRRLLGEYPHCAICDTVKHWNWTVFLLLSSCVLVYCMLCFSCCSCSCFTFFFCPFARLFDPRCYISSWGNWDATLWDVCAHFVLKGYANTQYPTCVSRVNTACSKNEFLLYVQAASSSRLQEDLQPSMRTNSFRFMSFRHWVTFLLQQWPEPLQSQGAIVKFRTRKIIFFLLSQTFSKGELLQLISLFDAGWVCLVFFCCLFISKTRIRWIYEETPKRIHLGNNWFFL